MGWNFNPEQYNEKNSMILAKGEYRVRITKAADITASNGTEGLELSFDVSGCNNKLRHYIWYNRNNEALTNQLLGEFFNSFGITEQEYNNYESWIGKLGAVYVTHIEYKGRTTTKVSYCISRDRQDKLPEWKEPPSSAKGRIDFGESIKTPADKAVYRSFGGLSF